MYCHYTNPAAAQSMVNTRELWGGQAGQVGYGGLSARAFEGPHDPNIVDAVRKGVEFTSKVKPPRWVPSIGGKIVLWPDQTLGTITEPGPSGNDVVKVPICVLGV